MKKRPITPGDPAGLQAVIVTWNKKNEVLRLLEQLFATPALRDGIEIVVVDNHSTDGTAAAIESRFPGIVLLELASNRGGAGGFNTGMRWVLQHRPASRFMWLLDNDVQVTEETLYKLLEALEADPAAAMCGSRIMDAESPNEMIELGGLIDYRKGEIRRHLPSRKALQNGEAVFEVDYVAACSLLVRTEAVRRVGLLRERFFIYWDDMEWGARCRAAGYKILAANGSIVYHPSWAGRIRNASVVWREYYRTRNSLCFFNTCLTGLRRPRVLVRMILRFMKFSASTALRAEAALSRAFVEGVSDFMEDHYGRRETVLPQSDLNDLLNRTLPERLVFFLSRNRRQDDAAAAGLAADLVRRYPGLKLAAVVPFSRRQRWQEICGSSEVLAVSSLRKGAQALRDAYRVALFLGGRPWQFLVVDDRCPRLGALWNRPVARFDFSKNKCIAIEQVDLKALVRLPFTTVRLLAKVIWNPPVALNRTKGKYD